MSANPNRLMIVDDEDGIRDFIRDVAEDLGFDVEDTADVAGFKANVAAFAPSVISLDLLMPGAREGELLNTLAEQSCRAKIMVMSGLDGSALTDAERLGESHGLQMLGKLGKPITIDALEEMLRAAWIDGDAS